MAPPVHPALLGYAGFLMNVLGRKSRMRFAEALAPLGLQPPTFGLLTIIEAEEGVTQHALGAMMGIDPSTMVGLVDQLEQGGFAERRPHPGDRRAHVVQITPKGRRALERGRRAGEQVQEELLGSLTPGEREELLALLRKAVEAEPIA
jgi:DNA-binding MarR family transcriptional regulator